MAEKKSQIAVDAFKITLIRRTTRKTLSLVVKSDNTIRVLAPYLATENHISGFIRKNTAWIQKRLTVNEKKMSQTIPLKYVSGEKIGYLGQGYILNIIESSGRSTVRLNPPFIEIQENGGDTPTRKAQLIRWYKERARDIFEDRLRLYEPKITAKTNTLRLSSAKTRWGSCSTNHVISLRWLLIMAPIEVIDYVVIHELCHCIHMNHSKSFWMLVKTHCPDYLQHARWLKQNGHTLAIF